MCISDSLKNEVWYRSSKMLSTHIAYSGIALKIRAYVQDFDYSVLLRNYGEIY